MEQIVQFRYHFEKGGKEKRSRPRVLVVFEDKNQGGGIKERHMLCCCVFGTTYQRWEGILFQLLEGTKKEVSADHTGFGHDVFKKKEMYLIVYASFITIYAKSNS